MAANRTERVKGRIILLISSIITTPRIKKFLVNGGNSLECQFLVKKGDLSNKYIIVLAINIDKDKLLVGVNMYGHKPIKLKNKIIVKSQIKLGPVKGNVLNWLALLKSLNINILIDLIIFIIREEVSHTPDV